MKKIININFQGRVIPIEETAYDILKQYVESLRKYFANEEGRDEIINDIEMRIAELFSDRLKRTAACITDEDVNTVIAGIGRPEDLEEAEGAQATGKTQQGAYASGAGVGGEHYNQAASEPRRLYRSSNEKLVGGVASGLANYFGVDPAIMRLIFVLFLFMGFGFLLYIILWIVLPARALVVNVRKRLYRNSEHRMIGGVASGIAAYFNIDIWIPRIIFLTPFILGVLARTFRSGWMDFDPVPNFLFNGFGGTLMITYIVLWIVLPEATTATEKLEMRGEKVDLESIKKTVKEDLESLKGRAEKVGGEIKDRAQHLGAELTQASRNFTTETAPLVRRTRSGLGHAIGVLFKAFFLFLAGVIVFALLMGLVTILFSGIGVFPFKEFLLTGFWQNFLAWSTFLLFVGVPIIALLTWLIRRIIGVKSRNHYLGYVFGSLWILGLVSAVLLTGSVARSFRSKTSVKEDVNVLQPANNKFLIKVTEGKVKYYGSDWFGFEGNLPFFSTNEDSIIMNNVRVKLIKSNDSMYHVYQLKFSNGSNPAVAERLANRIKFNVSQTDSVIYLPKGFSITHRDKFRNQQVMLVVEIPIGKKIEVDRNIDNYHWFNINMNNRRHWDGEWDDRWDDNYPWNWSTNTEYVMTSKGLESTAKNEKHELQERENRDDDQNIDSTTDTPDRNNYRYKKHKKAASDSVIVMKRDPSRTAGLYNRNDASGSTCGNDSEPASSEPPKALYTLLMLF